MYAIAYKEIETRIERGNICLGTQAKMRNFPF